MKTVLLFSSVFYLLGLKTGNTIEILKRIVAPVRTMIAAPAVKHEQTGKSYFFKPEESSAKKELVKKKNEDSSPVTTAPSSGTIRQKPVTVPVQ